MTEFPILQFGASRFLQARVDLFVREALARANKQCRFGGLIELAKANEARVDPRRLEAAIADG